jgi:hypothetical protein
VKRAAVTRPALLVLAVALVARLGVAAWASGAIPPAADGTYYHTLAARIASGQGYTWLWPDGAVTYAAHYPVGYPALVALGYAALGPRPVVAMVLNALIGAGAALAAYDVLARATRPSLAVAGGLVVALHPALVPYTAALMTEGVTASLLVVAAALAERARERRGWLVALGVIFGVATLVRPQSVALAPIFGWLATPDLRVARVALSGARARAAGAAMVTAAALAVCAPWTARNCVRMQQCALVSVNGGWNLAIGTQTVDGGWHEIAVPDACKEVFAEAAKDACFGREATKVIARDPWGWLARAPRKVRATFDYLGAAPWYLNAANPSAFPHAAKVALGTIETLALRLLLAAALVAVVKLPGPRTTARKVAGVAGLVACVLVPGAAAYLALAIAIALLGTRALERSAIVLPATCAVVLATAATHAVFFGAGRYGLVVVPFVAALAFLRAAPGHASAASIAATSLRGPSASDSGSLPEASSAAASSFAARAARAASGE